MNVETLITFLQQQKYATEGLKRAIAMEDEGDEVDLAIVKGREEVIEALEELLNRVRNVEQDKEIFGFLIWRYFSGYKNTNVENMSDADKKLMYKHWKKYKKDYLAPQDGKL